MDLLPESIILKIFSYLSIREKFTNQRVSKAWQMLFQDFTLWTEIDTSSDIQFASLLNDDILATWLARWGIYIRRLRLRYCSKLTDRSCFLMAENCRGIVLLDLQGCMGMTDYGIENIAKNCRKIKKVNLFMTRVTDFGCNEVIQSIPNLTGIKLPNRGNCSRMLQCITANCSSLNELIINDIIPLNKSFPVVTDSALKGLTKSFPMLAKLSLSWCWYITDEGLASIANNCTNLRQIVIRECHQITDEGVGKIIGSCLMLRKVYLGRQYGVTDRIIECFGSRMLSLQWLKIIDTSITDKGITRILQKSPEIRGINIGEYCYNALKISGNVLYSCAKYCPELSELTLVSSNVIDDCMLIEIARSLPKLRTLLLSSCQDVTKTGLRSICSGCVYLEQLKICNCNGLTDILFGFVMDSLMYIKSIDICGCTKVTRACVEKALKRKPSCVIRY